MSFADRIGGRRLQNCPRQNCSPHVMRSTLTAVPENEKLLKKAKLPFGILLWPFKDVQQLSIVTTHKEIVRCSRCRTYINPFVTILDQHRWRCQMCLRSNDIPQHFLQFLHSSQTDQGQIQYVIFFKKVNIKYLSNKYTLFKIFLWIPRTTSRSAIIDDRVHRTTSVLY